MIKFDNNLNRQIQRTVKNFNAKVRYNKTKTRGKGMLPRTISVKELKEKYSDKSRAELQKQLKLYQSFGQRDALERTGNSRLSKWEENYFKANLEKTKQFYEQEISDLTRIIGGETYQHLRLNDRLTNLKRQQEQLDKDFSLLDENEIKLMRGVFNYAERSDEIKNKAFHLYLSQLSRTMANLGYPKREIEELLNRFNILSENEFTEMIRNEDLLDAVYDLVDSPKSRGEFELMTDENRARGIVEEIKNRVNEIISKYKTSK